jgi:hypothetical protein
MFREQFFSLYGVAMPAAWDQSTTIKIITKSLYVNILRQNGARLLSDNNFATSTKAVSSIYSLMVFSLLEEVALIKVGETQDGYCYGPQNGLVYI